MDRDTKSSTSSTSPISTGEEARQNRRALARTPAPRDIGGRFLKGYSGNPAGRPTEERGLRELARTRAPEAIAKLVSLMRHAKDERVQLLAAEALLDRGFGRPMPAVSSPLVSLNFNGAPAANLTPEQAYKAMLEGAIPADPTHPAFRPPLEVSAEPDLEEPQP